MRTIEYAKAENINGGKRVHCPVCGKNIWVNPIYAMIRFWWSKDTWELDAASEHYYGGYNPNAHR